MTRSDLAQPAAADLLLYASREPHPTPPIVTPAASTPSALPPFSRQVLPPAAAKGDRAALADVMACAEADAAEEDGKDDPADKQMNPRVREVLAVRLCEKAERIKTGTNKGQLARALEKEQVGGEGGLIL